MAFLCEGRASRQVSTRQALRHQAVKSIRRAGCPTPATSTLRLFLGDLFPLLARLGKGDRNGLLAALDLAALAAAPALSRALLVAAHLVAHFILRPFGIFALPFLGHTVSFPNQ